MLGCQPPGPARELSVGQENGVPKVAVVIEYDGTNYYGFQKQARGRTIQSQLELVLRQVTQEDCPVLGAGRTDSGVHARGQIVHFQTNWKHPWVELVRAMNALLPDDISVRRLFPVTAEFHARYGAQSRLYRYSILNRQTRSPFAVRFAYHVPSSLQVEAMNRASECLIGRHDFASFGQSPTGGHAVREVYSARWSRQGDWVFFDIEANAFLRRMVRSLVGTFLLVGGGQLSAADFVRILEAKDRKASGPTAPPQGLCLERVTYPAPWQEIG